MKKSLCLYNRLKSQAALLILVLFSAPIFSQPVSQTFNSSGNYVVPAGYSATVTIEVWGGGGGGGTNVSGVRAGGGGGAYASSTLSLGPGSYPVTVGTGGNLGANGTASSFSTLVIADFGLASLGASGGAGGTVAGSTGTTRLAGNNGNNGAGNNGGSGGAGANGGAGGSGGLANNGHAGAAVSPGGGGGGKAGPGGGGLSTAGANGRVIVTVNVVLPVKFSSINAVEKSNGVLIEWNVYGEQGLLKYQVERSEDGQSFLPVGEVLARNVETATHYSLLDQNPGDRVNYYRIRIYNLDGKGSYSSIIKINLDKTSREILVYPNPVTSGYVSFQSSLLDKGTYTFSIWQVTGQKMYSGSFSHAGGAINHTIQLPTGVKAGVYTLRVESDIVKISSNTFIVK